MPEATSSASETDESKLSLAAALEHPASTASTTNSNGSNLNESGIETDLRKSLVKSRLGQVTECQLAEVRLPRSDSIDSMLGDSLLDPPQVANNFYNDSNFSCRFLNPNYFSNLNYNCSNLLDLRNHNNCFWQFLSKKYLRQI